MDGWMDGIGLELDWDWIEIGLDDLYLSTVQNSSALKMPMLI